MANRRRYRRKQKPTWGGPVPAVVWLINDRRQKALGAVVQEHDPKCRTKHDEVRWIIVAKSARKLRAALKLNGFHHTEIDEIPVEDIPGGEALIETLDLPSGASIFYLPNKTFEDLIVIEKRIFHDVGDTCDAPGLLATVTGPLPHSGDKRDIRHRAFTAIARLDDHE